MAPSIVYITFWIGISCCMILFNKAVLDQLKFPFPMFLCTWHMVFATVCTQIMARTTNMLPGVKEVRPRDQTCHICLLINFLHSYAQGKVDAEAMKNKIVPVSAFFAVSLVMANKAYIYLSVSYIQVSESLCCL